MHLGRRLQELRRDTRLHPRTLPRYVGIVVGCLNAGFSLGAGLAAVAMSEAFLVSYARARAEGLISIVDGAHAPAQVPLDLDALGADFYAGNCHKWLCAPKGAGFLHVRPEWQERVDGAITSWGYEEPATFISRTERQGTRDSSAYLSVPAAIEFVRVPYDIQTTVKKVQAIDDLDDFLGARLIDGR